MLQLGVNSPFKSGADYWRESSEPARVSSDGAEGPQTPLLAPVGHLFEQAQTQNLRAETPQSARCQLWQSGCTGGRT